MRRKFSTVGRSTYSVGCADAANIRGNHGTHAVGSADGTCLAKSYWGKGLAMATFVGITLVATKTVTFGMIVAVTATGVFSTELGSTKGSY